MEEFGESLCGNSEWVRKGVGNWRFLQPPGIDILVSWRALKENAEEIRTDLS